MPPKLKVTRGGLSLPLDLRRDGIAQASAHGYSSFSAYVEALIEADLRSPLKPLAIIPGMPHRGRLTGGSISLSAARRHDGSVRVKILGLRSFSIYVQLLIQNDLRG